MRISVALDGLHLVVQHCHREIIICTRNTHHERTSVRRLLDSSVTESEEELVRVSPCVGASSGRAAT